jgi:hypothetical protein
MYFLRSSYREHSTFEIATIQTNVICLELIESSTYQIMPSSSTGKTKSKNCIIWIFYRRWNISQPMSLKNYSYLNYALYVYEHVLEPRAIYIDQFTILSWNLNVCDLYSRFDCYNVSIFIIRLFKILYSDWLTSGP